MHNSFDVHQSYTGIVIFTPFPLYRKQRTALPQSMISLDRSFLKINFAELISLALEFVHNNFEIQRSEGVTDTNSYPHNQMTLIMSLSLIDRFP